MAPAVAVVGHVEWVSLARVERLPAAGEIVHALGSWDEAAGGGAVAAVQLRRLAGGCRLFTALGDDELGHRAAARLEQLGVELHVAWRAEPTRRAFVHTDAAGERTITVIGERIVPHGGDELPWGSLAAAAGVYLTGGDRAAAAHARRARVLVASPRTAEALRDVELDVLVYSGSDADEVHWAGGLAARLRVATAGASGGAYVGAEEGAWSAAPLPGPIADTYGCGDSFAAGLTFALGRGDALPGALDLAARCGAACLTGQGPYGAPMPAV